jgi:hypothetical protein
MGNNRQSSPHSADWDLRRIEVSRTRSPGARFASARITIGVDAFRDLSLTCAAAIKESLDVAQLRATSSLDYFSAASPGLNHVVRR